VYHYVLTIAATCWLVGSRDQGNMAGLFCHYVIQ